jgi:putative DNA primase/helicase
MSTPPAPKVLPPNPALMPPAMAARPQWVAVDIVPTGNPDRPLDKIPINPTTGQKASSTDPTTWGTIDQALARMKQGGLGGIGYVLSADDPYAVIDLDKRVDPETHAISPDAMATIERFGSYAEYSGSRTGIHIFVEGNLPKGWRRRGKLECYDRARLVWMTGCPLVGYETVRAAGDHLAAWHAENAPVKPERPQAPRPSTPIARDTEAILAAVRRTAKGRRLHDDGDWKGCGYPSQSEADQGLGDLYVAFGADRRQADDLFRRSGLMRDKWDARHHGDGRTYGEGTLDTAFDGSVRPFDVATAPTPPAQPSPPLQPPPPAVDPNGLPDDVGELKRMVAELLDRVGAVERQAQATGEANVRLLAENRRLRDENTMLINVTINPHTKGKAPTIVRAATRYLHAKRTGQIDAQGFAPMSHRALGDDFDDVANPILSGATVGRHLEELASLVRPNGRPLLERVKRTERVAVPVTDRRGRPVLDPETGNPRTREVPVERTWARFTGDDLAEILRPFAFFRPPEPTPGDREAKPTHGGDRRSAKSRALRTAIASAPACPHCGEDALAIVCGACGCRVTTADLAAAEAEETGFHDETHADPLPGEIAFQDGAPKQPVSPRGSRHGFQDENGSRRARAVPDEPPWLRDAPPPDGSIAEAWMHARPLPGMGPPAGDHRTDVTIGGTR